MKIVVPGVNKILGGFTTFCKGLALCSLDNKSLVADFKKRNDGYVKILMAKTGECKKFQTNNSKIKKEDKYCNAIKGVYSVLSQNYASLPGFDITLDGDLLDCEGHIVYSAVALASVKALSSELKIKPNTEELITLTDNALRTVGEIGSLSYIVTMVCAQKNQFVVFDGLTRKYSVLDNPFVDCYYCLAIIDGHVPTGPIKEEASLRTKEISNASQVFLSSFAGPKVANITTSEFRDKIQGLDDTCKSLCTYLFEETKVVANIEQIIAEKDIVSLGRVLTKIKAIAEEYLELICPEMDWIVKRAYETRGCVGACTFFEGYCTKAAIIIKKESLEQLKTNIGEYQHIFGFDFSIDVIG